MFKFFVNRKENNYFILDPKTIQHMKAARVFNEEFICIYQEVFYLSKYENNKAKIIKKINQNNEFDQKVSIAISIIDTKRLEWLIQKATELGATKLIPVFSKNVTKKISGDINKKVSRWNEISLSAAQQSFRNKPMVVTYPMEFLNVVRLEYKNKYIAYARDNGDQITSFPTNTLFLIGPEGGFTEGEVNLANDHGFKTISLGKRILRAETAGIFVLSKVIDDI